MRENYFLSIGGGPETFGWFGTDICRPQRINPNDSGDPVSCPIAPTAGNLSSEISQHLLRRLV